MRIVTTGAGRTVTDWGSTGVTVETLAESDDGRVSLAHFAPGGTLGPHPAGWWQVFAVIDGVGWVSGADEVRRPVSVGAAAVWEPGEMHGSGTEEGMSVVIVQATEDPSAGL